MDDLVRQLRRVAAEFDSEIYADAADEIERLRGALKTFADNVRKTNSGIDKNWAKTIYPLKAENQRLREALKLERQLKDDALRAFNEAQAALKEGK